MVFDLDWTLLYPLDENTVANPLKTVLFQGERYRVSDHTSEVLAQLFRKKDIRVSFYSGGSADRNAAVLKQIFISENMTAYDLAYKVLNKEDLIKVSDDPSLSFTQRLKKDLTKIQPDLNRVVLFDDSANYTLEEQKKNQLWLGKTYTFYEHKSDIPIHRTEYDPPTISEWRRERNKVLSIYEAIEQVYENRSHKNPASFLPKELPKATAMCDLLF